MNSRVSWLAVQYSSCMSPSPLGFRESGTLQKYRILDHRSSVAAPYCNLPRDLNGQRDPKCILRRLETIRNCLENTEMLQALL